ncbi:coiled-coil domain-containing protein 40 [Echeneis naucrates]|uniref:coiled-coil domain-containing protein 40 n=1 Tax=Echeneis naucrates TaxID=173247 RepID=UPI001113A6B9|nr:coiled-coil domain-containing protein 40 [Echeneis naucrates]
MQSPEGETGEGGGRRGWEEDRPSRDGEDIKLQREPEEAAEDWRGTVPLQDQIGPEPDDFAPQPHPDLGDPDEDSCVVANSALHDDTQEQVIRDLSNLPTSENLEAQGPLPNNEEEEEFNILDPEHPLVRRQQAALEKQLRNQLERLNLGLKEKLAAAKADASHLQDLSMEMYDIQKNLAKLQIKQDTCNQTKMQAQVEHQHAQNQLEATKTYHSRTTSQYGKSKANLSQLQAEFDNLMLHLIFIQGFSEDLSANVKAMNNARHKAAAEKEQAEEQKLKQDLYVERLTKDMERLAQQIAMYDAQTSAQSEETQAAKEALSEAAMEMESLMMMRKQLLQQWNSSLAGMRKQDEAFSAMQDAVRAGEHQVILLDREIEGYKKSTTEEQEQNETLTMQLNWSQMDVTTSKKLINQKQAQQEALQARYSTTLRTLRETERTVARLMKETSAHQAEVNDQRRQLEKESNVRLEMEDKIMTHMQQKLTHNKAVKYSQRLTSKIASLNKEKLCQLWQLENEVATLEQQSSEVSQHLDSLAITEETLDEEIAKLNKLVTSNQDKIASFIVLIGQKQSTIAGYDRKISQITASTGHEDLSPLQIKVEALKAQIEELAVNIESNKQLWMKRQGILVGMTQDIEVNSKNMLKLQTEYTCIQQKKVRLESQIQAEHREETEIDKKVKTLRGDLLKLNTLLSKNGQLSQALEEENAVTETEFLHKLKEAERESVQMQMKHEKTKEEKERLINSLVEAEQQIMLWEKKIQLAKETRSAVDSEVGQGDIQVMKAEIHRMEVRLNQLMKQQEVLLRESEATVARRETIVLRREAMAHSSRKQSTKGELDRVIQGLQRQIQDIHQRVTECEQVIKELEQSQVSLSDGLAQQKQHLIELCSTNYTLDPAIINLHDTKDKNLSQLVNLQSRNKKLHAVCEGSYQASSTNKSVEAALQSQMERVHSTSTILHRMCEEFPQHQGALRKLSLALATRTQAADQQAS